MKAVVTRKFDLAVEGYRLAYIVPSRDLMNGEGVARFEPNVRIRVRSGDNRPDRHRGETLYDPVAIVHVIARQVGSFEQCVAFESSRHADQLGGRHTF